MLSDYMFSRINTEPQIHGMIQEAKAGGGEKKDNTRIANNEHRKA